MLKNRGIFEDKHFRIHYRFIIFDIKIQLYLRNNETGWFIIFTKKKKYTEKKTIIKLFYLYEKKKRQLKMESLPFKYILLFICANYFGIKRFF